MEIEKASKTCEEPFENAYARFSSDLQNGIGGRDQQTSPTESSKSPTGTILPGLDLISGSVVVAGRYDRGNKDTSTTGGPNEATKALPIDLLLAAPAPFLSADAKNVAGERDIARMAKDLINDIASPEPSLQKGLEDSVRQRLRDLAADTPIPQETRKEDLNKLQKLWKDHSISREMRLELLNQVIPYLRGETEYPKSAFRNYSQHDFER